MTILDEMILKEKNKVPDEIIIDEDLPNKKLQYIMQHDIDIDFIDIIQADNLPDFAQKCELLKQKMDRISDIFTEKRIKG